MLTQCPTCSSLMSSHAYESHRYVHDSTDRSFMCESGCMEMFFETADELHMHQKFMHGLAQAKRTNLSYNNINTSNVSKIKTTPPTKTCFVCNRTIPISNMKKHMTLHSPTGRPFQCALGCPSTYFTTSKRLSDHNLKVHRHTKQSTATCAVCGMVTCHMKRHMRMHDSTRHFQCVDGCLKIYFESRKAQDKHRHREHKVATLTPVSNPSRLTTDIPATGTMKTAACTVCSRILPAHNMNQHMKCHLPTGRPFPCTYGCLSTHFATAKHLGNHKRKVHNIMAEKKCLVCNADKPSSSHMKTHDPTGRPFECTDGCVKTFFTTREQHTTHRRVKHDIHRAQTELSKIECTVCGRTYPIRHLSRHMAVHNSEGRPFKCDDGCKKTYFVAKRNLCDHRFRCHRDGLKGEKQASTRLASPTTVDVALVGPSAPASVDPTVTSTALRSIINITTVQTMVKMEPTFPKAKRARMMSTVDSEKNILIMSSESLQQPQLSTDRSPSSSSSATVTESSSSYDRDDYDWKAKKSKCTLMGKSTTKSPKYGPTAISTLLLCVSRKRQICTVSPIVRADDVHEEGVTVEKSALAPITNVVEKPLESDVKKSPGENDKLTRHSLMMQLINLPSNASEEKRTRLLDLMESCE